MSTIPRKLMLVVGACLAAMALSASSASADTESVFKSSLTWDECDFVAENCLSSSTDGSMRFSWGSVIITHCSDSSLKLVVDREGNGVAKNINFGYCPYETGYFPCVDSKTKAQIPYPIEIYPASEIYWEYEGYVLDMDFCFESNGYKFPFEARFDVELDEENRIVSIDQSNETNGINSMQFDLDGAIMIEEVEIEE